MRKIEEKRRGKMFHYVCHLQDRDIFIRPDQHEFCVVDISLRNKVTLSLLLTRLVTQLFLCLYTSRFVTNKEIRGISK